MGKKEHTLDILFLPEYISGQGVDLLCRILERSCQCLNADISLIGTTETVKDMS